MNYKQTEPVVEGLRCVWWGAMTETMFFKDIFLYFEAANWVQLKVEEGKAERPTSFYAQKRWN